MAHVDQRPGIRPRSSLGRRLDITARTSFPAFATIFLMLLTQAPVDIPEQAALLPAVALCCVWFWSLHRPGTLPSAVVFLIGLLLDLLGYLPLGVGAFTLLAVHGVALALRDRPLRDGALRYRPLRDGALGGGALGGGALGDGAPWRGFGWAWASFAAVAVGALLAMWLLVMLLTFRLLSPYPVVFIAILAITIFPVVAAPFFLALRTIANPGRA